MQKVSEEQIRLVSIEPEKIGGVILSTKVVKLAVFDEDASTAKKELLTVSLTYDSDRYRDDELVRIARADFHELCRKLAETTSSWALTDGERAECVVPWATEDLPF